MNRKAYDEANHKESDYGMVVVWSHPPYKALPVECYCGFETIAAAQAFIQEMRAIDGSLAWHHPILVP